MASIHRTNQTIGTLYHFASPAASRMDGDRELREERARRENDGRVRTGSRKQYYTY